MTIDEAKAKAHADALAQTGSMTVIMRANGEHDVVALWALSDELRKSPGSMIVSHVHYWSDSAPGEKSEEECEEEADANA